MEVYEFLVPGRPVSVHASDRKAYRAFKDRVYVEAARVWPGYLPFADTHARLSIVFFGGKKDKIDVDNIIKPVMDALEFLYYADDAMVSDVDAHRRTWKDDVGAELLPDLLKVPWAENQECVFVRIQNSRPTEDLP